MRRLVLPIVFLVIAAVAIVQMVDASNNSGGGSADASVEPALDTPVLSPRRAPEWLRQPKSDALLSEAIRDALNTAPVDTCVLIERNGTQLAANNISTPLHPANLNRLVTATVVDSAGNGGGFRTEIAISSDAEIVPNDDGTATLQGDIWIIGSGDPGLATNNYIERFTNGRIFTEFDTLASDAIAALQSRNIVSVTGRIVGDESKYSPNERDYYRATVELEGRNVNVWSRSGGETNEVGPLSALLVNDGFESWSSDDPDQSGNVRSSVPSRSAASLFDDMLEEAGISVSLSARDGVAPPITERETLAEIESVPLDQIIGSSLVDATTAEMLLKEYGIRSGTTAEREAVVFALAVSGGFGFAGLPFDITSGSTLFADGSGRSEANRSSCEMIHATIVDSEGIVSRVMPAASESPVAECAGPSDAMRIYAAADGATTGLAGWYDAPTGERLTFTMMVNDPGRFERGSDGSDPPGAFDFCNEHQVAVLGAILGHPYGPSLDQLGPIVAS